MTRALIIFLALMLLADIETKHIKAKVMFAAPPFQHPQLHIIRRK